MSTWNWHYVLFIGIIFSFVCVHGLRWACKLRMECVHTNVLACVQAYFACRHRWMLTCCYCNKYVFIMGFSEVWHWFIIKFLLLSFCVAGLCSLYHENDALHDLQLHEACCIRFPCVHSSAISMKAVTLLHCQTER